MKKMFKIHTYIFSIFTFILIYSSAIAQDIQGNITLVNKKDNLVRLNKGGNSGVSSGLSGIIIRSEKYIALVKVVVVEANTSVAKIVEERKEIVNSDSVFMGTGKAKEWRHRLLQDKISFLKRKAETNAAQNKYEKAYQLYNDILALSQNDSQVKKRLKELYNKIPRYGFLTVESDPNNASIYINDSYSGKTPFRKKLSVDKYNVEVISNGWKPEKRSISILENKRTIFKVELLKAVPDILRPEDIGRVYKKPISIERFKKPEYELKRVITSGTKYVRIGVIVLVAGMGIYTIKNDESWFAVLLGIAIGGGSWLFPDKETIKIPIKENVEYNKKIQIEIDKENAQLSKYNQNTKRLLKEKLESMKKKVKEFNKNRKSSVVVKEL